MSTNNSAICLRSQLTGEEKKQTIPFFHSYIPCGFPSPALDYAVDVICFQQKLIETPSTTEYHTVNDLSMTGAGMLPGSLLILDSSKEPLHGETAVFELDSERLVRYLYRSRNSLYLVAAGGDLPAIKIKRGTDLKNIGKVKWILTQPPKLGQVHCKAFNLSELGMIKAGTMTFDDVIVKTQPATYAIKADGMSMTGAGIYTNSILVIDNSTLPEHRDIGLFEVNKKHNIKYLSLDNDRAYLIPANPGFPIQEILPGDEFDRVGRVSWVLTEPQSGGMEHDRARGR